MSDHEILIQTVPHRGEILNGQWRLLTPTAIDEFRRIRLDPKTLAEARTRRQRQQGLTTMLVRGTPFANGRIDGHPTKVLTWADATGQVHACTMIAVDDPVPATSAGSTAAPNRQRTRLIRIIHDTQGNVSYTLDVLDALIAPSEVIAGVSALALGFAASKMMTMGKRMREAASAAVELTEFVATSNQIARSVRHQPVIIGGKAVRLLQGARALTGVSTGIGIIGTVFAIAAILQKYLLSRMTVSIEVMNFTDEDYEWTISEIDSTSVWLNKPDDQTTGDWALLPGIVRSGEPLPGMEGSYDSVASVEVGIANSSWATSHNTTRLSLSIRRKNNDAPPFVFLFSMPPNSANTMAIETGTADAAFFEAHREGMQTSLSVSRDLMIDGLPVSLEATTDRNTGETSYAELRGRNYSLNLVIGARRYRILAADGGMALDLSDDGTHVVQRPIDLSATSQEWMLMARTGTGHEIIHRDTRKALTVSLAEDSSTRLTLEARRATATGQPQNDPMSPVQAMEWLGQAFLVRNVYGDSTPVLSLSAFGALDVQGASKESGAPVILWPPHLGPNQMFRFQELD